MKRWDIFCRIVDNFGDIGVCWRLGRQLAQEHRAKVRLWVDNLQTFASLCPSISIHAASQQVGPIEVCHWSGEMPAVETADIVIEAFACELPDSYLAAMAQRSAPPVWINLEYLSAEDWVEDCHLGRSPHPKRLLTKYFFFPGFTPKTGGLLREHDLLATRARFDATAQDAFWKRLGLPPSTNEEFRVSMFCYENPALPQQLEAWTRSAAPIRLLAAPGAATWQIAEFFKKELVPGDSFRQELLTVNVLPFLSQDDYDRLMWSCDVNFVRGEDSFVRAQWAQRPFVWQIYPQAESTHLTKLDAFLDRYLDSSLTRSDTGLVDPSDAVRRYWLTWNSQGDCAGAWREFMAATPAIEAHGRVWAHHLDRIPDLADNLARFVHEK